jgi:hypothetical protein
MCRYLCVVANHAEQSGVSMTLSMPRHFFYLKIWVYNRKTGVFQTLVRVRTGVFAGKRLRQQTVTGVFE